VSILPPTAINNIDSDGYWEATRPNSTSPLLVFVNTKSGDNQASFIHFVKFVCSSPYFGKENLLVIFVHYFEQFLLVYVLDVIH
jgi:hypothetical protein